MKHTMTLKFFSLCTIAVLVSIPLCLTALQAFQKWPRGYGSTEYVDLCVWSLSFTAASLLASIVILKKPFNRLMYGHRGFVLKAVVIVGGLCALVAWTLRIIRNDKIFHHRTTTPGWVIGKALAHALGPAGTIMAAYSLLPVTKSEAISVLLGLPADVGLKTHTFLGRVSFVALLGHGILYFLGWWFRMNLTSAWKRLVDPRFGIPMLAGTISLTGMIISIGMAHPFFRRRAYRLFYFSHTIGFAIFVIFAVVHVEYIVFYFAPATITWAAEIATRLQYETFSAEAVLLTDTLIRLYIPGLRCSLSTSLAVRLGCPNLYVYIAKVRYLFRGMFHPFSALAINFRDEFEESDNENLTGLLVYIRATGIWTESVRNICLCSRQMTRHILCCNGPYEASLLNCPTNHSDMLLIGGGTGIIPLISILNSRANANSKSEVLQKPRTWVVFIIREPGDAAMLEVLPTNYEMSVQVYHTRGDTKEVESCAQDALYRSNNVKMLLPIHLEAQNCTWKGPIFSAVRIFAAFLGYLVGLVLFELLDNSRIWPRRVWKILLVNVFSFLSAFLFGSVFWQLMVVRHPSKYNRASHTPFLQQKLSLVDLEMKPTASLNEQVSKGLQLDVHSGRPELERLITDFSKQLCPQTDSTFSTVCAGPLSLTNDVQRACSKVKNAKFIEASLHVHAA